MKSALEELGRGTDGLNVKPLRGQFRFALERLKVGAWRAAFYREGADIHVVHVFPRTQGYDWLSIWELP